MFQYLFRDLFRTNHLNKMTNFHCYHCLGEGGHVVLSSWLSVKLWQVNIQWTKHKLNTLETLHENFQKNFTFWHEIWIMNNEFSVAAWIKFTNYSLAIGSKNLYCFTQMHEPNIIIHQYLIIDIILFFCLHQSDLLNWLKNDIFHIL